MEKSKEVIEVLNDLVMINNDRIKGYQSAIKGLRTDDGDLKTLFDHMILESQQIKSDLAHEIQVLHGGVEQGTSRMGKIYRMWAQVKAVFSGMNRNEVLSNCDSGEEATLQSYQKALEKDKLPKFIREMLSTQQMTITNAKEHIHELRTQFADGHL